MTLKLLAFIYMGFIALMSLVTFFTFIKDKKMAEKNGNEVRIKEKTLLGMTAFGGSIGAFIGRLVAHHKTNTGYFSFTIYVSLLLQAGLLVLFVLYGFVL